MRLDRATLAEAASWVSGAVTKNPAQPVLAGMRIQAHDGAVTLSGFDYDTLRQATIPCEGEAIDTVVSARFLTQMTAALPGKVIDLTIDGNRLILSAGRSTYRAQMMDVRDYPALPDFPPHVGVIEADMLNAVIGTVEHAVSKDPNLKAFSCFNIVGTAGTLTMTTTDRFRIARAGTGWADAGGAQFEANVPASSLSNAVKGLGGEVQIGFQDGSFSLSDASRMVVTRTLANEEQFPRLDPIFARPVVTEVEVPVTPLVEALKRAQMVSDDKGTVDVSFSDGLIQVSGDGNAGDGSEEVDCETGFGEGSLDLKFSAAYLTQALQALESPRVVFGLIGPGKQVHLKPVGATGTDMIVMTRQELR